MSPIRFKRKDLPPLLAMLLICGCAPEAGYAPAFKDQKASQAAASKKTCPGCGAVQCCPSAAVMPGESISPPAVGTSQYTYYPDSNGGAPARASADARSAGGLILFGDALARASAPPPAAPPAVFYAPEQIQTGYVPPTPVAEAVVSNNRIQKRPMGTWERSVGNCQITLRFEEDRLFGTCTFKDKGVFTLTMDADYSITKDNVLYGVITGSEAVGRDDAEEAVVYVDMPFSARVRQDGDLLTIKGVKFLERGVKSDDPKELIVIEGRYKRQPKLPAGTQF